MINRLVKVLSSIKSVFLSFAIRLKLRSRKYTHLYIGTPYYGNLGDQQIRTSALEFLKRNNIKYIELSAVMYYKFIGHSFPYITTICLQGGGNFGDIYPYDELLRDDIIRRYKDKKIILFPQTLHFRDDTKDGDINVIKSIFERHKNLVLVARESISFEMMKKHFCKNKILLTPDIVLSSNYANKYKRKRKNRALFLMRRDIEKNVDETLVQEFKNKISGKLKIVEYDTVLKYNVYDILRNSQLKKLFNKIASSRLVITDRLHGMIFSVITNTPCIVFSNNNHKIKATYNDWLTNVDYVRYIDNVNILNIDNLLDEILSTKIENVDLYNKYEELVKEL